MKRWVYSIPSFGFFNCWVGLLYVPWQRCRMQSMRIFHSQQGYFLGTKLIFFPSGIGALFLLWGNKLRICWRFRAEWSKKSLVYCVQQKWINCGKDFWWRHTLSHSKFLCFVWFSLGKPAKIYYLYPWFAHTAFCPKYDTKRKIQLSCHPSNHAKILWVIHVEHKN